jgi:hypothetical protein
MPTLDFASIARIEETLTRTPLDDLVAVFSRAWDERLLLVYNAPACPGLAADHCQAISLDELRETDLRLYDGPSAGISALDVIRDDLGTKGPGFYSLERTLLKLGQRPVLHRTLRNLARRLVDFLASLSSADPILRQRVVIKILQLALPALLDERGAKDLVTVLPGPDLAAFVEGQGLKWITVHDDLTALTAPGGDNRAIALEELRHFDPQVNPDGQRFVELRGLLHQAGYTQALRQTCQALAGRCAEAAASQPELWRPAWALMAEAWLMKEDVQDLVAFFPHADFERFARTGKGLRVYRVLDEEARHIAPGPRVALADLDSREIPPSFRRYGFSLIPLETIAGRARDELEPADLGWLLWKADHDTALAQTLSLLARDGLENAAVAGDFSPQVLSSLAQRAVMLISLSDPWAWRQGRHAQLLSHAYQVLQQALVRQAESSQGDTRDYYRALQDWHDCRVARSEEVNELLHRMTARLRSFLRATQRQESDALVINARQLIEVEEATLYPPAVARAGDQVYPKLDARALPSDPRRVRGMLARRMPEVDCPTCLSPVFERVWDRLRYLHNERYQVQMRELDVDMQQRKLEELLVHAVRHRQLIFAPPHEMTILRALYDREIDDLANHVHQLKTTARMEIVPLNPRVEFQREMELIFEVRNTGRVEAHGVELVLARDPTFELLERSPTREFLYLPPNAPQRFSYRVRAVHQPDAAFSFSYTYRGLDERRQVLLRMPVRSLDEAPFEMKGDPYKFGRAIQNPADFYGREKEMKKLLSSLARGGHTNFLLQGPRRMGKTSMLYMLKHALEEPEIRRRFDIPAGWDETLNRCRPVMLDLQASHFQDDQAYVARFFRTLLDAICDDIAPHLQAELTQNFDQRWGEIGPPRAVLEQLRRVFENQPQARVVVLLDEYDELYRPQGRILDIALRHVVQAEQRLTWVIVSTQFLFKEGKSHGSPWFNILDIVELDCLSDKDAQRLVEEPSRDERVEWQSNAIVALLDETGSHPAFLQLFCSRIMAYLNQERQNYVLSETIATLAEQIVQERETIHSHFEFYWTDTPGVGRLILLAADESDRPPSRLALQRRVQTQLQSRLGARPETRVSDARGDPIPWWEREFEDGMAWVSRVVNAIGYNRASRTYTFTVPLFRRWLQRKRRHEDLWESALNKVLTEMERDGLV